MKKIILSTLIALSFQSMAQTAGLEMNKILEPSREELEKRNYKELNDKMLKLKHNENAPLITEEQCFEQAYEELKRTPISPDNNNLNSPFKGYDNQIKGLTKFTNSQGRGMSCKDTTLLYIVDAVSAVKRINESNIEKEKKIENMIKASDIANQEADEKFRKLEEETEFNSNPKNFPYRETWYDYEKGIYEIKLTEITDQGQIQNIKNKYTNEIMKYSCESERAFNNEKNIDDIKTLHFYDYSFEEVNGFFANIDKIKVLKINTPFVNDLFFEKKYELSINPDSSLAIKIYSMPNDKLEYHQNRELKYLTMEHSITLNINNKSKKININTDLDHSSNFTSSTYFIKNKDIFPDYYLEYSWKKNYSDKVQFKGYNLNENILFFNNYCFYKD